MGVVGRAISANIVHTNYNVSTPSKTQSMSETALYFAIYDDRFAITLDFYRECGERERTREEIHQH